MDSETRFFSILNLIAVIVVGFGPAYMQYAQWLHGSPEARIEINQQEPMKYSDLMTIFGDKANVSVTIGNQTYSNVAAEAAFFTNVGEVPIKPEDFADKLNVTVSGSWKIILVDTHLRMIKQVPLKWRRVSDTKYEADPILLNPGDWVSAIVYMASTAPAVKGQSSTTPDPAVTWDAHIYNMRSFSKAKTIKDLYPDWGTHIELLGWGIPAILAFAALFQAIYLHFLVKAGLIAGWNWKSLSFIIASSLFSVAVAEVCTFYIFDSPLKFYQGVNHWLNAPFLVAHVFVVCSLYFIARRRQARLRFVAVFPTSQSTGIGSANPPQLPEPDHSALNDHSRADEKND